MCPRVISHVLLVELCDTLNHCDKMNHSQSAPVTRPLRPAAAQAQERMHANPDGIDLVSAAAVFNVFFSELMPFSAQTLHDEFVLRPARKASFRLCFRVCC